MRQTKKQQGVAAVEFAILLTFVLVPIVFGITEFGRALYYYNTLVKATRDAGRYYAGRTPSATPKTTTDGQTTECLAGTGLQTASCSGSPPLAPGLSITNVQICDRLACSATHANQGAAPTVNLVSVSITGYQFTSLVPFIVPSITFGPITTTMQGNT